MTYSESNLEWNDWFAQSVKAAMANVPAAEELEALRYEMAAISDAHDDGVFGSSEDGEHGQEAA